jgi:hypothetical protein
MSLSSSLEALIKSFISNISIKYTISSDDLTELWYGTPATIAPESRTASTKTVQSSSELDKLSKTELMSHCKLKGLKTTGNKSELIQRLSGTPLVSQPSVKKTVSKVPVKEPSVIKTVLQAKPMTYNIKKNEFGHFSHSETGLIFDKDSRKFYGKQHSSGRIDPLSEEDIELCNQYKFPYTVPENLKKNDNDDDEIGDDEIGDDEMEDDEMEEELIDDDM